MSRSFRCTAVPGLVTLVLCSLGAQQAAAQWSNQLVPNPSGGGNLFGISCVSPSRCIAVGQRNSGYDHPGPTGLVDYWNGKQWRYELTPKPRNAGLEAVSCVSSQSCMAVGTNTNQRGEHALAESWNGTHWTVRPNPGSALPNSWLNGVSCSSPNSCTAVGYYHHAGGGNEAVVERWNGKSWKIQPNPPGTPRHSLLWGVSCPTRSYCTAVGSVGEETTLIENWSGGKWTIEPDGQAGFRLAGVSCALATSCTAVGTSAPSTRMQAPFAEGWDGSMWSVQSSADPANTTGTLQGVSCTSSTACTAVGFGSLAERWDGSSWSVQTVPGPTGKGAALSAVSCPSLTRCIAVGSFSGNGYKPTDRPVAQIWQP